ncbi:hypothetical protein RJD39_04715 [Vibrio scophthalmi]|uniref:hypothetical protein n=1 Tax=Vibrio scophthalmi TaxID=45658 RepID=UPI003872F94D
MSLIKITVSPFDKPFGIVGRFFKVLSAAESVKVRFVFHDESETETELYQGLAIEHSQNFKSFFISSKSEQEVIIFASQAKLIDDRTETNISGAANLENSSAELVANQVTHILPARLGRRSVLIQCDSVTYFGGSNLDTTNGVKVDSGDSIELGTQGAIYAFSPVNQSLRILEEVN